jgi:hypothetical protein
MTSGKIWFAIWAALFLLFLWISRDLPGVLVRMINLSYPVAIVITVLIALGISFGLLDRAYSTLNPPNRRNW